MGCGAPRGAPGAGAARRRRRRARRALRPDRAGARRGAGALRARARACSRLAPRCSRRARREAEKQARTRRAQARRSSPTRRSSGCGACCGGACGGGTGDVSDLIVSVHIPKTGGVTFREALGELAAGRLVHDYEDRPLAPRSRWRVAARALPARRAPGGDARRARALRRERSTGAVHPDARFVTWFRDPIERLISHFHYWQREPDPEEPDLPAPARRAPHARRVRARCPRCATSTRASSAACPVERFAFVGLTERVRRGHGPLPAPLRLAELRLESARRNANPGAQRRALRDRPRPSARRSRR